MRHLVRAILAVAALVAFPAISQASPISIYNAPDNTYQNTANNPCIFYGPGGSGCNQNPAGWPLVGDTGGGDPFNPYPLVNNFGDAPGELLQFASVVGRDFIVGLDINDTSTAQTLDNFTINFLGLGGINLGSYTFAPATLVPSGSNGVGYADYILAAGCSGIELNGFCSNYLAFSAPTGTIDVNFTFGLTGFNDGADKVFLIGVEACPGCGPTPFNTVPDGGATLAMLGLAMTGLGYARRKMA